MLRLLTAATLLAATHAYALQAGSTGLEAEIRWTSEGIPHIQARDEQGLGYGVGYAYARDNACLLEDEVLTARGERARYLGAQGQSSAQLDNVSSDLFYRWLNTDAAVQAFWARQPAPVQALIDGYVAGFNQYLASQQNYRCHGQAWVKPLVREDLVRLARRLLVEGGVGRFAEAMLNAAPPATGTAQAAISDPMHGFASERGSNAIAVGGERTENGKGRLLANPHFPWAGAMRFWQLHLTIPGKLDVMGAALPGLPLVNIGFNQHLAWTHTVDSSAHFTLHRLQLDPADPGRYRVDGKPHALRKVTVSIEVLGADGVLKPLEHAVYESDFGPLVNWPGKLDWTADHAYALKDANLGNTRVFEQWYAMGQAQSVEQLRRSIEQIQGIPWVNTLAADDQGQALYFNGAVIPNVPLPQLAQCADPALAAAGLPGLDGSRSECDWQADAGAAQAGIVAGAHLPTLLTRDVLQNSNDSAWFTNPATPLTGFSPLISRDGKPLGPRARFALSELAKLTGQPLRTDALRELVTANRVYLAERTLDDLAAYCASRKLPAKVAGACQVLGRWDRTANLSSNARGYLYFQQLAGALSDIPGAWRTPFDPQDPINTPSGIAWQVPEVAKALTAALLTIADDADLRKVPAQAQWGQVQQSHGVAIPGGDGHLGVYNAIKSEPAADGHLEVESGSSYIQLVSFNERGPQAQGVLSFSQASEPSSPHFADQTRRFSAQQWAPLPFTREQIGADPGLRILRLRP